MCCGRTEQEGARAGVGVARGLLTTVGAVRKMACIKA